MSDVLGLLAIILSLLAIAVGTFFCLHLSNKVAANQDRIGANNDAIGKNKECIEDYAKAIHELKTSIEDMKVELATAKSLMFAYEAKLKAEQGCWCLEHEGNKKWYAPGTLLRTESANGQNVTEFSYDVGNGNVSAISRSRGKLVSAVTFSKFGTPIKGKVYTDGIASKEIVYDKLGQVVK